MASVSGCDIGPAPAHEALPLIPAGISGRDDMIEEQRRRRRLQTCGRDGGAGSLPAQSASAAAAASDRPRRAKLTLRLPPDTPPEGS